ncbi:MAG: hypothetical protein HY717_11750 [Planctomycetes bacterium]|nr:hypothetical protein [Planctomycetota bacterium]
MAQAQITVEGLTDRKVYADRVSFRVPAAAGYEYTILLDNSPVPADLFIRVDQPDYHELLVKRRLLPNGAPESRLIQFIVRASARGNSEWGLPPWIPYPSIPSAAGEFNGAQLRLIAPERYPQGLEIPVVAWVEDAAGERVGVNGAVNATPQHALFLRRGVGSGFLPPAAAPGRIDYAASIHALEAAKAIDIEAATGWTAVSGSLAASANWGQNARVHVTGDLTVAAGATLTIGAGSVIKLGAGVEITVDGALEVNGTREQPVVFTPASRSAPWGGLLFKTSASRGTMSAAIFTGSGADPQWFDNNPGDSHRHEQPLLNLAGGARATLTDCALIDNQGQAGHGEGSFLTMTRCLVQRAITTGQYNGGSVNLTRCALMEFPYDGAPFEDKDNDALYLTGGSHTLTKCLIGWSLDDGVDAGSGSAGPVTVTGCWIESTHHEGMAWSETRLPAVRDTVVINCGQGIECGFGSPQVKADHCLSTANLVGARFGDNYDWTYNGFLTVTNSLLLFNRRDIWGRTWKTWTEHLSQMDLNSNFLSVADPLHPSNSVWQPPADAFRLEPFLPSAAGTVGLGFAARTGQMELPQAVKGIPVRLSAFTTSPVSADYALESSEGPLGSGSLSFVAGETVKVIPIQTAEVEGHTGVQVLLKNPVNAELTGISTLEIIPSSTANIIPAGSLWKYSDTGANQGTAWRAVDFDDGAWKSGPAELGFGDDDEATVVSGGPSNSRYPTIYFRHRFDVPDPSIYDTLTINLRRDDGAVVHINGGEVFRSNMPTGTIDYNTFAADTTASETDFYSATADASVLKPGANVIAVEVHQANATSSDLSFELELVGDLVSTSQPRFVRGDANGDAGVDLADAVRVLLALFAGAATSCQDAHDADDNGLLEIADALAILQYLFLKGPPLLPPFPARGVDTTTDDLTCKNTSP